MKKWTWRITNGGRSFFGKAPGFKAGVQLVLGAWMWALEDAGGKVVASGSFLSKASEGIREVEGAAKRIAKEKQP